MTDIQTSTRSMNQASGQAGGQDLLIELGMEELPPKSLQTLMGALHTEIMAGLDKAGLSHGEHRAYGSPRRLAVLVDALQLQQPDQAVERRGPAVKAAFDANGEPTRAALGFAESCGVAVADLETMQTDKGEWLVYRGVSRGEPAAALIPGILDQALARLPIPRRMRWGSEQAGFIRPVHWLVLLLGDTVIDTTVFGVSSGRTTHGHRFHAPEPFAVSRPADYAAQLESQGYVIADFQRRRKLVHDHAQAEGARLGGHAILDPDLLDEVTALVEWPVAIAGSFDEEFLRVPAEALISSMQGHQKYFPLRDNDGRLMPRFITMANLRSKDPAEVARGNERVIRPRLADASFFWDQDRRQPLSARMDSLKQIIFQQRLGSLHDKSVRVAALARQLAGGFGVNGDTAEQGALLAKCDLLTEMVGEFPELQGTMGRYYAEHDGLGDGIPLSLDEQYLPRFAGDSLPASPLGQVLAIADRIDTLMGIFAIGQAPTGDKDPFALRRAALGLMRILVERQCSLSLHALLKTAAALLPEDVRAAGQTEAVFDFCMDRLKGYYLDQGYSPELIDAVRSLRIIDPDSGGVGKPVDDPLDFHHRLQACAAFQALPEAESLAAANKRVKNILRKADSVPESDPVSDHFREPEERQLFEAMQPMLVQVGEMSRQRQYTEALTAMAAIRKPVDAFFERVMVMADEPQVRDNRLALLRQLRELLSSVADLSRLPGN